MTDMLDIWTYRDRAELGSNVTDTHAELSGFSVEALDGSIGKVDESTYDVGRSHIVVDTGPWIFGKKVLLPAGIVRGIDELQLGELAEQVFSIERLETLAATARSHMAPLGANCRPSR